MRHHGAREYKADHGAAVERMEAHTCIARAIPLSSFSVHLPNQTKNINPQFPHISKHTSIRPYRIIYMEMECDVHILVALYFYFPIY